MGKKRKITAAAVKGSERTKYDIEERFDGSEDEFYAGREKILLDEGPSSKRQRRIAEQGMSNTFHIEHILT